MYVFKKHAFIFRGRPPTWSGTLFSSSSCSLFCPAPQYVPSAVFFTFFLNPYLTSAPFYLAFASLSSICSSFNLISAALCFLLRLFIFHLILFIFLLQLSIFLLCSSWSSFSSSLSSFLFLQLIIFLLQLITSFPSHYLPYAAFYLPFETLYFGSASLSSICISNNLVSAALCFSSTDSPTNVFDTNV